jgi:hypothetical protein
MLVTINKFDCNPILVNFNKLKPYKFIGDQTLQPILVKLNEILSKEPIGVKYFDNLFNYQQVEETYSNNLSKEKIVETIHSSNLFVKEPIQTNKGLIVDHLTKTKHDSNFTKPKLVQ